MSEIPVDPNLSRMLIASGELKCADDAAVVAAMLSGIPIPLVFPPSSCYVSYHLG